MRSVPHSRLICLFLILSMLLLGIHVGNADVDSSFACNDSISDSSSDIMVVRTMGIQKVDSGQPVSVFCERKLLEQSGESFFERQSIRSAAGMRAGQWPAYLLLVMLVFLSSVHINISFIQSDACRNLCRCRILEYIHHKDGKKA